MNSEYLCFRCGCACIPTFIILVFCIILGVLAPSILVCCFSGLASLLVSLALTTSYFNDSISISIIVASRVWLVGWCFL